MKFGLEWAHRHRQIRLVLSMPASALFNTWVNFTCTAYDEQTNTVITDYNGIVHFTPNGGGVNVGAGHITGDSYLVNGTLTGSVYFTTGGGKSISANDTVDGSIVGTSNGCNIITYVAGSAVFYSSQWYTLPSTFNPTSNQFEMYAGGGGGATGGGGSGGGGGGGGYSRYDNWALGGGTAIYVEVGAGGAVGQPGGGGGHSGIKLNGADWNLYATGGAGGNYDSTQADNAGGSGITGNVINTSGGTGMSSWNTGWQVPGLLGGPGGGCGGPAGNGGNGGGGGHAGGITGGAGGGGNAGAGGDAAYWDSANVSGKAYGGGGGGGAYTGGGASPTAGAGGPGLVKITWQGA